MYVYKVTNKINGKIYIGQTSKGIDVEYFGSGPVIMKALKKYGKKNFSREIIEICESKSELNEKEIFWINYYKSTDRNSGYNISRGGNGGNLGEIVNEKISESLSGRILAKDINGNVLIIDKNDQRFLSGELVGFHKGRIAHNKGKPMSEDQKEKLRKPKPNTPEYKEKMRIAKYGKNFKKVFCIENNTSYESLKEAAEKLNLALPNIVAVLKGRAKKTKGYSFVYL